MLAITEELDDFLMGNKHVTRNTSAYAHWLKLKIRFSFGDESYRFQSLAFSF